MPACRHHRRVCADCGECKGCDPPDKCKSKNDHMQSRSVGSRGPNNTSSSSSTIEKRKSLERAAKDTSISYKDNGLSVLYNSWNKRIDQLQDFLFLERRDYNISMAPESEYKKEQNTQFGIQLLKLAIEKVSDIIFPQFTTHARSQFIYDAVAEMKITNNETNENTPLEINSLQI